MNRMKFSLVCVLLVGTCSVLRAAVMDDAIPEGDDMQVAFGEDTTVPAVFGTLGPRFDALIEALRTEPDNAGLWSRLGDVLFLGDDPAKASAAFYRALRIEPMNQTALKGLAACFLRLEDYVRAHQLLTRISDAFPDDEGIRMNLASALSGLRRYDEARTNLLVITSTHSDHAKAFYNLGVLALDQQQPDKALEYFLQAYELQPANPLHAMAVARMYARMNRPEEMYDYIRQAADRVQGRRFIVMLGHPVFESYRLEPRFQAFLTQP